MKTLRLCILVLAAACRPDAGVPNYPIPNEWNPTEGDPDFYGDDPFEEGDERLAIGVFYEGGSSEEVPIDDATTHLYVYENTFSLGASDDRVEGYVSDALEHAGGEWWGGGVHWDQPRDLSGWDTLHFAVKSREASMESMTIGMTGGGTEARVSLVDFGFVADGTWHTIEVPLQSFVDGGADMSSVSVPLTMGGEAAAAGDTAFLDDLYFTNRGTGVEDPDFYGGTDPYQAGDTRLSLGAFYESDASAAWEVDGETKHFYIYENTFTVSSSDDRVEGFISDVLTAGSVGWMGGGLHTDVNEDLSAYDTLHVALKSSDASMNALTLGMTGGSEFSVSASAYGFTADGEWHDIYIPLADLEAGGVDLSTISVGLVFIVGSVSAGETLQMDDLYLTGAD